MAKTEQAHRPIGSVGSDCLDQSEESCKQASTNQERRANNRLNQSEEFHEAEKAPLNQSDLVWQGALADASSRQKDRLSSD